MRARASSKGRGAGCGAGGFSAAGSARYALGIGPPKHSEAFGLVAFVLATAAVVGCRDAPRRRPSPAPLAPSPARPLPEAPLEDFALVAADGRFLRLHDTTDVRAVVLVGFAVDSAAVERDAPELGRLARACHGRVRFCWIDAGGRGAPAATRANVRQRAAELGTSLEVLVDDAGIVVPALGLERAGEALLVDTDGFRARYRGSVAGLGQAIDDLFAGRPVAHPSTGVTGEPLARRPPLEVDYARDVAPVLVESCLPCHRERGLAPFSLGSWEDARGWSPMMREAIRTRRMPPWHADPGIGRFDNDRSLHPDEARAIVRWAELGAPRGSGIDPLPAAAAKSSPEWPLGEPDLVVRAPRVDLPATGELPWIYSKVLFEHSEDVWVRAVDLHPSNVKVAHHIQVTIRYPEHLTERQPDWDDESGFALYAPGQGPRTCPPGTGRFLPAGSLVVFELHYTTTGRAESDEAVLGLYLLDEPPAVELETTSAYSWDLHIPAGEPHHVHAAEKRFDEATLLHQLMPHMHYRGRSMTLEARYPDGRSELLVRVPDYHFDWQTLYVLEEPRLLPAGTVVRAEGVFDNSPHNPFNPDPTVDVVGGQRTTDEMFIGFLIVNRVE